MSHCPPFRILIAAFLLAWMGSAPAQEQVSGFRTESLAAIDAAINQAIDEHCCPGAAFYLEHGKVSYQKVYGKRALVPASEEMTEDTIFDAASLTKVLATTPSIMQLIEQSKIELDAPVCRYLPEFTGPGRENITVRHLLTHTSGLPGGLPPLPPWTGREKALTLACTVRLQSTPGTAFRYSDINFILLGELVRTVSGESLDVYCKTHVFEPLQMKDTGFLPAEALRARIAPTETDAEGKMLRGIVHDPTSRRMGGVAGHAGLFTTVSDVSRYARMLLGRGELDGVRILQPETVDLMTHVQSLSGVPDRRGLGWDIDSPYAGPRGTHFPIGSYGHTGWTGGALWIDPFSKTFMIFLTNRNHPDGKGNVISLWKRLGTLSAEAIQDFDFSQVPGALPKRGE